eukprot:6178172-Pleurochrysis_carterae.AAC.8
MRADMRSWVLLIDVLLRWSLLAGRARSDWGCAAGSVSADSFGVAPAFCHAYFHGAAATSAVSLMPCANIWRNVYL